MVRDSRSRTTPFAAATVWLDGWLAGCSGEKWRRSLASRAARCSALVRPVARHAIG